MGMRQINFPWFLTIWANHTCSHRSQVHSMTSALSVFVILTTNIAADVTLMPVTMQAPLTFSLVTCIQSP
jgi:hypothetical protein